MTEIDDDHFEYEGGMRQCISGFGRNAKECVEELLNHRYSDTAHNAVNWHIDELVRWCRGLTREAQEIRGHNERLIEELLTNGSGWDRESLLAFIRNPPTNEKRHEPLPPPLEKPQPPDIVRLMEGGISANKRNRR